MPIGSALAAAGTFLAKTALPAVGTFLKTKALPAVGKFVTKEALPALGKAAVSKVGSQLLSKGAPAAFSFGQARNARQLQGEYQGQIDDLFASAQGRLDTDRFAGLSVPTTGLELALDASRATAGDFLQRVAEGDQRGLAAGGRALMAIQEAQQKAGATYDDRLANLQLRQAIGGQQADAAAAELELEQVKGLQGMLADQRARQMGATGAGIDLLSQLAAGLAKKDPFDGDESSDLEEDIVETGRDSMGGFSGGGSSSGSGMAGFTGATA
jgi:hypothetical protein